MFDDEITGLWNAPLRGGRDDVHMLARTPTFDHDDELCSHFRLAVAALLAS